MAPFQKFQKGGLGIPQTRSIDQPKRIFGPFWALYTYMGQFLNSTPASEAVAWGTRIVGRDEYR